MINKYTRIFKTISLTVTLAISLITNGADNSTDNISIVPKPYEITTLKTSPFKLTKKTRICYSSGTAKAPAELLAQYLNLSTVSYPSLKSSSKRVKNLILLTNKVKTKNLGKEGYELTVSPNKITIAAPQIAGLIYGVQTMRQLVPVQALISNTKKHSFLPIPAVKIVDKPHYPWRGMMLDVSRYFFKKEFILKYIDIMAMHKMNVLHWHLVDDAGWRIEIKKYPKLTKVGAFRGKGDQRYGGFYTQAEIKEIVKYAAKRNVQIMPEIELPAHVLSAIVSYPNLCCTGKQMEMPVKHFISKDIYCVGKESTWIFLKNVLSEVCKLFPFEYIHIGGDEAKYNRWKKCPDCQKKMKELGLKSEHQLQGWITCRVEDFLQKKGKKIIGWDEILGTGISNKAGIMTWHRANTAAKGAKRGNKVVMSLTSNAYFDTPESSHPDEPPAATWIPPISLKKAYSWDPLPKGLNGDAVKNILGASGCIWADQFLFHPNELADKKGEGTKRSEQYVEYLSLPRMAALAEVTWTPESERNWDDFSRRMNTMFTRYSIAGYNFRMPMPKLKIKRNSDGSFDVTATTSIIGATIHYTTDGSLPTPASKELKGTVRVQNINMLRVRAVSFDKKVMSLATTNEIDVPRKLRKYGKIIGQWKRGELAEKNEKEFIFDATGKINKNGKYTITFVYTRGKSGINIFGVEVIKNGRSVVAKDIHTGSTGKKSRGNKYEVSINDYETGASFKIRARLSCEIGNNSNGFVFIK